MGKHNAQTFVSGFLPNHDKFVNYDFFISCNTIYDVPKSRIINIFIQLSEATTRGVLYKKLFLKMSQNLQENTCIGASFLIK